VESRRIHRAASTTVNDAIIVCRWWRLNDGQFDSMWNTTEGRRRSPVVCLSTLSVALFGATPPLISLFLSLPPLCQCHTMMSPIRPRSFSDCTKLRSVILRPYIAWSLNGAMGAGKWQLESRLRYLAPFVGRIPIYIPWLPGTTYHLHFNHLTPTVAIWVQISSARPV